MFEYGLWEEKDLDRLLTKLYSISEIMYNLENYIYKDRKKGIVKTYFIECKTYCTKIRELVSSIFLQLIIFYLDKDIADKIKFFPTTFSTRYYKYSDFQARSLIFKKAKANQLFKNSFFTKKKLYTYFSYILVTYLARYKKMDDREETRIYSPHLANILSLLFTYISDINGDFYRTSLKMMNPNYFPFYHLKQESSIYHRVENIQHLYDQLVEEIKIMVYGKLSISFDVFLRKIISAFDQTKDFINENIMKKKGKAFVVSKKIVLTLFSVPQYILALLQIIGDDPKRREMPDVSKTIKKGISLIRSICIDNQIAQNQIFSGHCFVHWE